MGYVRGVWLGLLLSCALRAVVTAPSQEERATAAADALWERRAAAGNLDAAMEAWLVILARGPENPEVLARLARGAWTRGQLEAGPGREHFELGQDYGYRCLLASPSFAARVALDRFLVAEAAAEALPYSTADCVRWTLANGVSILALRGPGAGLSRASLEMLSGRLNLLEAGHADPMAAWAGAKLRLLAPPAPQSGPEAAERRGTQLEQARRDLEAAIASAPNVLFFRAELADAFPDARPRVMEGFVPAEPDLHARENARDTKRLRAMGVAVP